MRGLSALLAIGCVAAGVAGAAEPAQPPSMLAIYWQPPGGPARGAAVHAAFAQAMRARHAALLDATEEPPPAPSLAGALDGVIGEYRAFHFADAVARLDDLARLVDARGGADLDARQLSEIYLYRGLSRLELGQSEPAWDDFVRAARLDPTRALDPAQFPPRATAAYQRAVAGAATLPRAELEVRVPDGAQVRLDGRPIGGVVSVTLGEHYVSVKAEGDEPWSGVVTVSGAHERFSPPLRAWQPPDGDRLLALAGGRAPRKVVLGALVRADGGWRFVGRVVELPDGRTTSGAAALDTRPVGPVVAGVVRDLLAPALASTTPPPPPTKRHRTRWWVWALVGGAAAALAVAIPVGVVYSEGTPSVGGAVGPLR